MKLEMKGQEEIDREIRKPVL